MACSFLFARFLLISVASFNTGSATSLECRDSDGAPEELALVQRQASVLSMNKQQQEQDESAQEDNEDMADALVENHVISIEQTVKPTLKFQQRCKAVRQSHHGQSWKRILLPEGAPDRDSCLKACQIRSEGIDDMACCQFIGPLPSEPCKGGEEHHEGCTPKWMGKAHMDVLNCSYCEQKNHLQHQTHNDGTKWSKSKQDKLKACNKKGSEGKAQNGFHFGDCDKETMCWLIIGDDAIVSANNPYSYAGLIDAKGSVPLPPLPETPSPTDSPTPSPTTPSPTDSPTPSPTTPSPTDSPTEPTGTCTATTQTSCARRANGQVPVCIDGPGCDSKAFSPGAKFCLNGKTLEVDEAWNSWNGCKTQGATLNFLPKVNTGCSADDVITFGECGA